MKCPGRERGAVERGCCKSSAAPETTKLVGELWNSEGSDVICTQDAVKMEFEPVNRLSRPGIARLGIARPGGSGEACQLVKHRSWLSPDSR